MARIIEAKAVISAEDRTGKVLDGVAKKFREAGKASKISAETDKLNKSLAGTRKQLEAIEKLRAAKDRLGTAKFGLGMANAKAEQISAKLAAARKADDKAATAALVADQQKAQREVLAATRAFGRQGDALREAKRDVADFGVPIGDLVAHEARLRAGIEKTTAALEHETAALKQRDDAAKAEAKAKANQGQRIPSAHSGDRQRPGGKRREARSHGGLPVLPRLPLGPLAGVAGVYEGTQQYKQAAAFDRRMTMIGQTADATRPEIDALGASIHSLAQATATPIDKLAGGLEALVAQGRNLNESLEFLPSVAATAAASGSEVDDIARSADSVGSNFKIAGREMQDAFDIMAAGGKAGQFELKDMARHLPSLAPAAKAAGFEGKKGLADIVAMLQVIRKGTGSAEEAATSLTNVFTKMESEETTKRFKKMGVDLTAAMAKGRKEGRNLVDVLEEAAFVATKGDLSKIPQLFADQEFGRGMRALMSARGERQKLSSTVQATSAGTVLRDLARVSTDAQAGLDRTANSWAHLWQSLSRFFDSAGGSTALETLATGIGSAAEQMERLTKAYNEGGLKEFLNQSSKDFEEFAKKDREDLQQHLGATHLDNLDLSIKDQQKFIAAKERDLKRAKAAVEGGGANGWLNRGKPEAYERELAKMREKLAATERERDVLRNGPRPLRFGTDPTAPIEGKPGPIAPGPKAWLDAFPLLLGSRVVPLPPQRPGTLPVGGAPSGIGTVNEVLAPGGARGDGGWSAAFGGKAIPVEVLSLPERADKAAASIPGEVTLPEQAVSPLVPHPLPPSRPFEFGGKPIPVEVLSLPERERAEKASIELDKIDRLSVPDQRLEATVRPDQITAKVDQLPPISGEASVNVQSQVNVAVTLNEPMLNAKVEAAAGRAAAKMSLSSSGARPGAVSMPGAASTPGAQ